MSTSGSLHRTAAVALVGLFLGSVLALTGTPAPVFGYAKSCVPGRAHDNGPYRVHTQGAVTGINGLSANILELDPYYSGYNNAGTNSTILLTNQANTQWAQLGWFKSKIDGATTKRQSGLEFYIDGSHNYFQWFGSRTVQTQTWYEILFESGQTFNFFVGGTYVASYSGFTPYGYNLFTETHDLADQMPGTPSNFETFTSSVYFTGASHSQQHFMSSVITPDSSYFGGQRPANGTYYVWDTCKPAGASSAGAESGSAGAPLAAASLASGASATLSGDDLHRFGIVTAVEVTATTDATTSSATASLISGSQARMVASTEIAIGANSRIYRGTATRTTNGPAQPVWIVTVPGGTLPFDGPVGAPAVAHARLTGVIIDATSGEVWSGFMH
jgi:hypothetical protein